VGWLVGALLVAPVFEEWLFRAGLRSPGYTLGIGPSLVLLNLLHPAGGNSIAIALAALLALVVALVLGQVAVRRRRRPGGRFALGRRFVAHYAWVFWGYTEAFALVHMGNYEGSGARTLVLPLLVLPLLVLPQLPCGAVLGYLRLRDGLRSSMLMHASLLNGLVALLLALAA
jgi:hypothetical protein